ncbi:MAG: hypothetical protein ACTSV2_15745 [Candidatus Thorarchaeota archaeon]
MEFFLIGLYLYIGINEIQNGMYEAVIHPNYYFVIGVCIVYLYWTYWRWKKEQNDRETDGVLVEKNEYQNYDTDIE